MADEIAGKLQLFLELATDGELQPVALGRQRLELWQPLQPLWHVCPWKTRREQLLDLPLRLARDRLQQLRMVFEGDVVAQGADARQMNLTLLEQLEDHRVPLGQPCGSDPVERLHLAQAQPFQAIGEQRGLSVPQMKPASFHLRQMRHDARFDAVASCQQRTQFNLEIPIRQPPQLPKFPPFHLVFLARRFSPFSIASCCANARREARRRGIPAKARPRGD